jgi:hypothetical protein
VKADRDVGASKEPRRAVVATALAGGLLLWHDAGWANEPSPRLQLVYEAPADCPSRFELESELRARVSESWLTGSDPRRFEVRIARDDQGGFVGRLDVRRPEGEPHVREIRARTCRSVTTSIAVFLSIALDPATEEPKAGGTATGEPRPAAATPTADATSASGASRTRPRPEHATVRSTPTRPTATWIWSSGYQATHLRMPEAAWGGRVHVELARMPALGSVGVAARLSWGWADFSTFPVRAEEAKFRLRAARVEGCARATVSAFVVSPCAGLDVGTLRGRTPELPGSTQATTRWGAAAVTLRASWSLSRWLSVEAGAGILVPLEKTDFVLEDPFRTVYRAPAVLVEGGAGVDVSARF